MGVIAAGAVLWVLASALSDATAGWGCSPAIEDEVSIESVIETDTEAVIIEEGRE